MFEGPWRPGSPVTRVHSLPCSLNGRLCWGHQAYSDHTAWPLGDEEWWQWIWVACAQQQTTDSRGHRPRGPSFTDPLGGAKSGQKPTCNVETTNKEIQINPEYCNLGGKEKGNKSHSIEFCSLLIQFWAFPVWGLKSVILSYLWVLPGWGFFGSSHSLSCIPIARFIYFWFSSFHTFVCGTADELCIFYSWCRRHSHSVTAQFWFMILGVLKNLNLCLKRWEWM